MKKLALVGYGKMGKLVEQLAPEYGFDIRLRQDSRSTAESFENIDVTIEFSTPAAAPENLKRLARARVPCVSGTTGWFEHFDEVREVFESAGTALVWSTNFSPGMAVFRRLAAVAAELLGPNPEFEAWTWEIHHSAKKDAPSGTLKTLVNAMRERGWTRPIDSGFNRAGKHPGTHEIGFDSAAETITLRHTSRSREAFARGALHAAAWIIGRTGIYTFDEVLFGTESRP